MSGTPAPTVHRLKISLQSGAAAVVAQLLEAIPGADPGLAGCCVATITA